MLMVVLIKELATTLEKQRTGTTVTCGWVVSYAYRGQFYSLHFANLNASE